MKRRTGLRHEAVTLELLNNVTAKMDDAENRTEANKQRCIFFACLHTNVN